MRLDRSQSLFLISFCVSALASGQCSSPEPTFTSDDANVHRPAGEAPAGDPDSPLSGDPTTQPPSDGLVAGDASESGDPSLSTCATLTCTHGHCVTDGTTEMCLCDAGYLGSANDRECSSAAGTACEGVTCSGQGNCTLHFYGFGVYPECHCVPGHIPYGQTCIPEDEIYCRDTAGVRQPHGTIRCDATDTFLEVCHDGDGDGYVEWIFGATCTSGGACASTCLGVACPDQPCPVGTACVAEAHGQPLGVCVATCDCSNCGNCDLDNSDGRWDDWQEYCGAAPNQSPATGACALRCPSPGDGCIPYDPPICWPMEGCFSG